MTNGAAYKNNALFVRLNLKSGDKLLYGVKRYLKIGIVLATTIVSVYAVSIATAVTMSHLVKLLV